MRIWTPVSGPRTGRSKTMKAKKRTQATKTTEKVACQFTPWRKTIRVSNPEWEKVPTLKLQRYCMKDWCKKGSITQSGKQSTFRPNTYAQVRKSLRQIC